MHKANSNAPALPGKGQKPNKPYEDFPLFAHAAGVWAKKIRGQMHYFGKWDDPDAALKKYLAEKDALHAGLKPREDPDALTLKELCNRFLNAKQVKVDAHEMTQRSWQDYYDACELVLGKFGKSRIVADLGPDDFETLRAAMVKREWGITTIGNVTQRVRVLFKYAYDSNLIDRPVRYGPEFKRPAKKALRIDRAKKGPKLFTADEVQALVSGAVVVGENGPEVVQAGKVMRAMVLLGINCGFGNSDCGHLQKSHVDLDGGVIVFPRPKTGVDRKCILWPETVAAIRDALRVRPTPKSEEHADLVFVTKYGLSWHKDTADQTLSKEFTKLLRAFGIKGRKGLGFYTLRHTFRTVADAAKDQPAADYIMGHESTHMSSHYREVISDERLKAVSDHVRKWVFGGTGAESHGEGAEEEVSDCGEGRTQSRQASPRRLSYYRSWPALSATPSHSRGQAE